MEETVRFLFFLGTYVYGLYQPHVWDVFIFVFPWGGETDDFWGHLFTGGKSQRYQVQWEEEGTRSSSLEMSLFLQQLQSCWDEWFLDNYLKCLPMASHRGWAWLSLVLLVPPCPTQCCLQLYLLQKMIFRRKFPEKLEVLQTWLVATWNPLDEKVSDSQDANALAVAGLWMGSGGKCSFPPPSSPAGKGCHFGPWGCWIFSASILLTSNLK